MIKLQIILGSTRDVRLGGTVAQWALEQAMEHKEYQVELVDLKDWNLPMFNASESPATGKYSLDLVKQWSKKIASADAYIVVTPEYNHGYPGVLKNAMDYLYKEWNNKPIAFVGYGGAAGGSRAVEQLRQVVIELQMAPIRESVVIPNIWSAFADGKPGSDAHGKKLDALLGQLHWWAEALKSARESKAAV